ncbi:MAG: response regulator [Coriobacteriia bacterium]|nr:response regulator [Coriobacteriia bacterium]
MIFEAMLVDDEAPARVELTNQLERTGRVKVVSEAVCLQEAIAKMRETRVDVAFIDHNIVGAGTTLLPEALPSIPHVPMFIYMTAYSDYQDEPFGLEPLDYLAKPVDSNRLDQVIQEIEGCYKLERSQA